MSDLNNKQDVENGVDISSQKKDSLFNKFITDFSHSYFSGNEKNSKLDSIFKSDSLNNDFKKELELFLALKGEEFSSGISRIDLKKLNVFDFRKRIVGKFLELNNKRQNLKDKILGDFDIPKDKIVNIDNEISSLTDLEINNLLKKDSLRDKFLKKIVPTIIKKQDAIKDFFLKFDILIGYTDFSQEKKDAIMNIFNDDGTLRKINIGVLDELFEAGIFNLEQKKEIISYFIPSISLSEIRKLKLYGTSTDNLLNDYKISIIDSFLNENNLNLATESQDFRESILSLINEDDIKISSLKLLYSDNFNSDKLDELIETKDLNDFVNSYNKLLEAVDTHESKTEFNNGLESFKKQLEENNKINGLENFKEGNYIVLDLYLEADEKQDKDITKQFFKIKKLDNGEFGLSLIDSGFGSLDLLSVDFKDVSYKNFINIISKGLKINSEKYLINKCNFQTDNSLQEDIRKGAYEVLSHDDKTKSEIEDEFRLSKLKEEEKKLNDIITDEISKLDIIKDFDKEISEINLELLSSGLKQDKKDELLLKLKSKLEEKRLKIDELMSSENNDLPENIRDLKNIFSENEKEIFNLENIYSYDRLLKNVDEFDNNGKKYGLSEGVSFTSDKGIFTISKIDLNNNTIDIYGIGGTSHDISFKDFFQEFKKIKSQRLSSTLQFNDLINNICTDTSIKSETINSWSNFEIKNNGINKKGSTKNIEYDYLKSTESNELLKIESISGDKAVISFGEYDDYEKDENGNLKKDKDGNKIKKSSITMYTGTNKQVSISWIESWIKSQNATPSSIDENKDVEKTDVKGEKITGSFLSRYMSRLSIFDIMSGMKLGLNSIESYLKEGTDEKSARAAQGLFGKVLPESLRNDLMTRVEESQKKRAEEYVNKLGNVDSWKAARMIIGWLKNKDAPQYLKEAGALFMIQKYGVLYAKDLYEYKGTYLFYESLGGKIGDELFEEVKADAKRTNQNFTEEHLVYVLLVKQCKESGHKGIKRRSRLHKEFKRFRANGKTSEYETGQGDAKDERTVGARIKGAMGELSGGTYANARGWLEEVVNKGGSMEEMNKIPFIMAFSGVSYNFEQSELDQLKNFPAKSKMLPILRFLSLNRDIDLINETILEVCNRYSKIKGDPDILKDANEIFSKQKINDIPEKEKIIKTEKFYGKYGTVITDILYMLNTGNNSDDSYLNKMILIEKDDRVDDNGKTISGNITFKRYFDTLNGYTGEFAFGDDGLYSDSFSGKGTSGINIHKATKELLQQVQGGTYKLANAGPAMWDEISKEIDAVIKRDYGIYGESGKENDLKHIIRGFIGGLLEAHGTNATALRSLVSSNSSTIYSKTKEWGIDLTKIMKYSYSDVTSMKAEGLINEYVDILLKGKQQSTSSKFDETIFGVKDAANDSLIRNAA